MGGHVHARNDVDAALCNRQAVGTAHYTQAPLRVLGSLCATDICRPSSSMPNRLIKTVEGH